MSGMFSGMSWFPMGKFMTVVLILAAICVLTIIAGLGIAAWVFVFTHLRWV
jgi:hypothetical protein